MRYGTSQEFFSNFSESTTIENMREQLNIGTQQGHFKDSAIINEVSMELNKLEAPLFEMAQIGWYNDKERNERESDDTKSIWVYGNEGSWKHLHFYRGKLPKSKGRIIPGGGCLLLEEARYFTHGTHTDTLNREEIKSLVKFLSSVDPDSGLTIWKSILIAWNQNNPDNRIDPNQAMPPYSTGIKPY